MKTKKEVENKIEVETLVSFASKKEQKVGKVTKIYQQEEKTYYKILCEKKYYYKQLKDIQVSL
jgi:hypothetical protein